jgi:hypothetical protein
LLNRKSAPPGGMKAIAWACTFCVAGTLVTSALLLEEAFIFNGGLRTPLEVVAVLFLAGALLSMLIWALGSAELWVAGRE